MPTTPKKALRERPDADAGQPWTQCGDATFRGPGTSLAFRGPGFTEWSGGNPVAKMVQTHVHELHASLQAQTNICVRKSKKNVI